MRTLPSRLFSARIALRYRPHVSYIYKFKRGDRVVITTGRYEGIHGTVDSIVFQRAVDCPEESAPGYHVILATEEVVTVQLDQVEPY